MIVTEFSLLRGEIHADVHELAGACLSFWGGKRLTSSGRNVLLGVSPRTRNVWSSLLKIILNSHLSTVLFLFKITHEYVYMYF